MRAEYHAAIGGAASAGLAPVLGIHSLVLFAASVLIDFDHYLDYVWRNRLSDLSVRGMFRFNTALDRRSKGRRTVQLSVFHTVECLLIVGAVAVLTEWPAVWALLWGFLLHLALDIADLARNRTLFVRAYSLIEYIIRWSRLRSQGAQPELPYRLALEDTLGEPGPGESDPA
jgi:hypothetical protein